jgi:hypothetical protein
MKLTRKLFVCHKFQLRWCMVDSVFGFGKSLGPRIYVKHFFSFSQKNLSPVKTEKNYVFAFQFLNDKINQNTNFAKLPRDKWLFFYITVNFIIRKSKSNRLVCLSFLRRQDFWENVRKYFTQILVLWDTIKRLKVPNGPSYMYSWSISHIVEHEFFC